MLKTILFLLFTLLEVVLLAQHSYTTLKIEHQYNTLEAALKLSPNNDTLILKKLLLVANRYFSYEDQAQQYTFNFEKYDYQQRLAHINRLLAQEKNYTIADTVYQYIDLMFLRAQIHLSEAKDELVKEDYKTIIAYLKNNMANHNANNLEQKLLTINDYFQEFIFYTHQEDSILFYQKEHLHILNQMLIINNQSQFQKENPYLLLEIKSLGKLKAQLLKDLALFQDYIDYLQPLMRHTYEYILTLNTENQLQQASLLEEAQNNLYFYASELAQAYYQLKDYNSAELWAQAYIDDMQYMLNGKTTAHLSFYNIEDYTYKCHELRYNIALLNKKQDLEFILKELNILLEPNNYYMAHNREKLEKEIKLLLQSAPKSGELYALYALFKINNRQYYYHEYAIYGKEILALLSTAEDLKYTSPYSNLIKTIIYIELENNKELGTFYFQKALKDNPNHYTILSQYIEDLDIPNPLNSLDDFFLDTTPEHFPHYNFKLPKTILQLLYKK